MPPPGSVLARGDSLPQTHAGMFRASAQRDREKNFSSLMVILACAGRPALARLLYSAAYVQRLCTAPMYSAYVQRLCTAPMYSLIYGDSLCTAAPYVHCCICIVLPMYSAPYA